MSYFESHGKVIKKRALVCIIFANSLREIENIAKTYLFLLPELSMTLLLKFLFNYYFGG